MFRFLCQDYVCLSATKNIEELESVFFLCSLHEPQIELILRIWLPLHINRIFGQQVSQRTHGAINFALNNFIRHLDVVSLCEVLILMLEAALTVLSFHVGDEAGHKLIHRNWDVLLLVLCHHLVSKFLQVVFDS